MPEDLARQLELARGERLLGSWPVEPAEGDRTTDRAGWLVLTSQRCLFFRKVGLLGSRLEQPPRRAWKTEELKVVNPHRFWMRVGYGDRLEMPGIAIDGQGFRLPRDTAPGAVVTALRNARDARRNELGLPLR
jgi:hypothetical protein